MNNAVFREMLLPSSPEQVWHTLTDPTTLAVWMFPNDFEPRVGHRFTFRVPGNPQANFDGLTVHCEVLECQPPSRLVFSWSAGGAVDNTFVRFLLQPEGSSTRLTLEHSGFDLAMPFGEQALRGAQYGWARMLKQLESILANSPAS
ncbi:MAG: SRPBCC domain-containing protein [Tepidisphaeraceae bacterium]